MHTIIKGLSLLYIISNCGSAPLDSDKSSRITQFKLEPWSKEKYTFEFETSSGQSRQESGFEKMTEDGRTYLYVEGSYSYIGSDSNTYKVDYYADDKGYHPSKPKLLKSIDDLLDEIYKPPKMNNTDVPPGIGNRILPPDLLGLLLG